MMFDSERKFLQDFDTIERLGAVLPPDVYTPPTHSVLEGTAAGEPNPNEGVLLNNVVYPSKSNVAAVVPDSTIGGMGNISSPATSSSVGSPGMINFGSSAASSAAAGAKRQKKTKLKHVKGYEDDFY